MGMQLLMVIVQLTNYDRSVNYYLYKLIKMYIINV